jgi:hypothetical protein
MVSLDFSKNPIFENQFKNEIFRIRNLIQTGPKINEKILINVDILGFESILRPYCKNRAKSHR